MPDGNVAKSQRKSFEGKNGLEENPFEPCVKHKSSQEKWRDNFKPSEMVTKTYDLQVGRDCACLFHASCRFRIIVNGRWSVVRVHS